MINYFASDARATPVNIAAARVVVGVFIIWKMFRYEWRVYPQWPSPLLDVLPIFRKGILFGHLEWIALLCGLAGFLVLIGYRLELSAWIGAVLLTYLGTVRKSLQLSHGSEILFTAALLLVIFAVFGDEHKISVDQLRRTRNWDLNSLTDHLETPTGHFRHRGLKWSLIVIGFFYFQAGFSKLVYGDPIAWVQSSSLGRYILFRMGDGSGRALGEFLLQFPALLTFVAVLTLVLEVGFLLVILLRKPIWPFFFGVVGMHIGIKFALGPDFVDQLALLTIFLPWDRMLAKIQRTDELTVVYDRHCFFCARSLHVFRYLDADDTVTYRNQYDVPDHLVTEDINFDEAMYAFRDGRSFRGYHAFRELFRQLGLGPVARLMSLPGITRIGERIYRHVAKNRSRYFVCSVET